MLTSRLLRQPQLLSRHVAPTAARPRARAFHASAPRRAPIDAWLTIPHEMLQLLHTSLPWYAALPVSAFLLRGALTLAVGRRVRASTARYIGLAPLRQALTFQIRDKMMREGQFKNPKEAKLTISRNVRRRIADLDRRWNCTLRGQLGWTLLQLPIFLTMADLIRHMCNTREGLLGMTLNAIGLGENRGAELHGVNLGPPNMWFDPTLASEGMLWFPNLIVPDPTGVLPFVVSALMFTNVYMSNNSPDAAGKMSRGAKAVRRLLLGVTLVIGPLCQEVPAAMLLYWASSTSSVLLWNLWLDRKFPAVRGFGACARPLLLMPPPKKMTALKTRRV
ncbi:hypothetical protein K505DRAFT_325374 [Melanomma pulvis-pyrius CBS 109.77]|uniref:Mitochondrial export translocase Oxa2 n=1 Tax=Melanomma pulvis-pyrius CBS 109.77 TaxID=1314802 RepID=A0A6A6XAZ4_9PLEO|nr:hypothetical protein K505DRAFT_325374 [Melanomma pulvis-pyrius CBS 109.77]